MRLKTPPQPVVFRFDGPTALCSAVEEIYRMAPKAPSALCRWQGRYFLQVRAGLGMRRRLARSGARYGACLGASPVLFAFCREHGCEISRDPVAKLGGALARGKKEGQTGEEPRAGMSYS